MGDHERRAGYELIATHPRPIVAMVTFKDRLFVATREGVFERREDGRFHELEFVLAATGENVMTEWRKYRSHKIVEAAPICEIVEHGGTLSILVKPYGDDQVERFEPTNTAMVAHAEIGGYAVRYADGFKSVSPKAAFDDGYRAETEGSFF